MTFDVDSGAIAILAVEDDVMVWMIVTDVLEKVGFRVVEAHDAHEALALLESGNDVQVMVTDCNMPGDVSGVELARLVRQRWPSIGVVLTSGEIQSPHGELLAGVQFLTKPYKPSALIKVVKVMMQDSD